MPVIFQFKFEDLNIYIETLTVRPMQFLKFNGFKIRLVFSFIFFKLKNV